MTGGGAGHQWCSDETGQSHPHFINQQTVKEALLSARHIG